MNLNNKSEPIFDRKSIWDYSKLIMCLIGLYIALFISYLTIFWLFFSISFLTISAVLFIYLIFRIMKQIDILYRLYKLSIFFSIIIYKLIYMLKS